MKRKFILIALAALVLGGVVSSCKKKEGCTDEKATNYDPDAEKDDGSCIIDESVTLVIDGVTYYVVPESISTNTTLTSDKKWILNGGVKVLSGATIIIQAGTFVYAADNTATPFLSIQRGGKIMAKGTATAPIVLTTVKKVKSPGSWGGIIVNGYGNINVGLEAEGEGGTGLYGGDNDVDNSGEISYVRVEYAGKFLGTDNELNGFSFNAVGSETKVDHIQAYMGADDGIEFFGGMVSVKYAVSTGNKDDSFDWTHGWRGNGQFWVAQQAPGIGNTGIEGDNYDKNNVAEPYSSPTIANVTLVGSGNSEPGIVLRHGTKGILNNILVSGFTKSGVGVVEAVATENMNARTLAVKNSNVFGTVLPWNNCPVFESDESNGVVDSGLNGVVGTLPSGFDPATTNTWFTTAAYKGAVTTSDSWMTGWTRGL